MAIKTANNQSMTAITSLPSGVSAKSLILLATETASGDATITFDSNIDSTYKEYIFKFYDLNPATDEKDFMFNGRDGGSSYDAIKTTAMMKAYHDEADTETSLGYDTGRDILQGTGFQILIQDIGNGADESAAGELHLFNPSSTTFVKHFYCRMNGLYFQNYSFDVYTAGYFNTTTAIDGVQFKFDSGNFDGTIKMYGVA
jgi:hypothetical protein